MKLLIAYASKYGSTAGCATLLSQRIRAETVVIDLGRDRSPDLSWADAVLIGGPIYGGKIHREIPAFCDRHRDALLEKKVGLFICCLSTGEHAQALLSSVFPDWLYAHAFACSWLGGELHRGKLTAFDRLLVRSLKVTEGDISRIREDAIRELAQAVNAFT
jgi:menaquinone-dependent protoporphyrinogen oxidase